MQPRRDQSRDVRDVYHKICADFIGDLAQAGEIDDARISRSPRNDHFRLVFEGDLFEGVVVDALVRFGNAVRDDLEVLARNIDGRAVRKMPAVGKVHAQNGIAGGEQGEVDGRIRLRAAVRLHVGVVAAEKLFAALYGEIFHDVHILAAAVIAFAGKPLRILVGEVRTDRRHDGGRHEVFACDQFDVAPLAVKFEFHRLVHFCIGVFDCGKIDHCIFSVGVLFSHLL